MVKNYKNIINIHLCKYGDPDIDTINKCPVYLDPISLGIESCVSGDMLIEVCRNQGTSILSEKECGLKKLLIELEKRRIKIKWEE